MWTCRWLVLGFDRALTLIAALVAVGCGALKPVEYQLDDARIALEDESGGVVDHQQRNTLARVSSVPDGGVERDGGTEQAGPWPGIRHVAFRQIDGFIESNEIRPG